MDAATITFRKGPPLLYRINERIRIFLTSLTLRALFLPRIFFKSHLSPFPRTKRRLRQRPECGEWESKTTYPSQKIFVKSYL